MVRLVNPFRGTSPIAETISQLGQKLYPGTLDREINTEKLVALQRGNQETDNLMGMFADGGAFGAIKSPVGQAMALGAGLKPADAGGFALLDSGLNFGAADPRTQNAQVASGQSYDNTAAAIGAKLAEVIRNNDMVDATKRHEFDMKPMPAIGADGQPTFTTQSATEGFSPVLSNTEAQGTYARQNFGQMGDLPAAEQAYLGADVAVGGKTPRNYVGPDRRTYITYDGLTDAHSGQVLPQGGYIAGVQGGAQDAGVGLTNAVTTDVQSNVIAADSFLQSVDAMLALTKNPENFGVVGAVRGGAQELAQGAGAVIGMFGGEQGVQSAAAEARSRLEQSGLGGLIPELYDPNLPAIDMLAGVLLYQGASVLAGQENRSVSDKDVGLMRQILGEPKGLFESAQSVRTKMLIARAMATAHRDLARQYLDNGMAVPEGLPQQALAQAIAQITGQQGDQNLPVAAVTDEAQEGEVVANPQTGERLILRNGQWEPL